MSRNDWVATLQCILLYMGHPPAPILLGTLFGLQNQVITVPERDQLSTRRLLPMVCDLLQARHPDRVRGSVIELYDWLCQRALLEQYSIGSNVMVHGMPARLVGLHKSNVLVQPCYEFRTEERDGLYRLSPFVGEVHPSEIKGSAGGLPIVNDEAIEDAQMRPMLAFSAPRV